MPPERWKPVPGYEDCYEVSDRGRVRRCSLLNYTASGRGGYPCVVLSRNGVSRQHYVHRLVARAFLGDGAEGEEVNHKDRDRRNPRLSNLEWVTRSGNVRHALANGARRLVGQQKTGHKLTDDDVRAIRSATGTHREIAARFGVHHATVGRIRRGEDWKHVTTGDKPRREAA